MHIRVFNYNTQERLASFEGHNDYIRHLEVHPTQPYVISSSDDMTAKLWDWEKDWKCTQTYEGHTHYIMMAKINPKDTNTFATASLDRSVKVWSLGSSIPNFSLEGHERGVNCLDYYPGGDKPYIVSGSDDHTLRVWDYQTRSCVTEMTGHTNNLCSVLFHPRLPLILSASEDGTIKIWQNSSYRLETTLNYGFQRAWSIAATENNNKVAFGFDDGTVVVRLAREVPVASMDAKTGRLVVARNNVIYSSSLRFASADEGEEEGAVGITPRDFTDGERVALAERELGTMELFPQTISHNSNGRFLAVCGNNEYVIYTSQALRNKSFGTALELVWSSHGAGDYAVRESPSTIRVFKNFKESHVIKPSIPVEGIFGGNLLGVRSNDALCFYDWDSDRLVRKIEVTASQVSWSDAGDLVAIYGDALYVLRYNRAVLAESEPTNAHEGYETAFDLQHEVVDSVISGIWVGDCFVYTNSSNRLNYYIGGEIITHAHLDKALYILGYLARDSRIFLIDNFGAVVSYHLSLSVLEYQTAVVRRDFSTANKILPNVPRDQYNSIAKFLESQGFKEYALQVADDFDLKFDLAIQLNKLDVAHKVLLDAVEDLRSDGSGAAEINNKWKQLLDLSLARSNIELAEECGLAAGDLGALLLIYTSTGDREGLLRLGRLAEEAGKANIAFLAYHSVGDAHGCVRVLEKAGQTTEAEIFSLVYPATEAPEIEEVPAAKSAPEPVLEPEEVADVEEQVVPESKTVLPHPVVYETIPEAATTPEADDSQAVQYEQTQIDNNYFASDNATVAHVQEVIVQEIPQEILESPVQDDIESGFDQVEEPVQTQVPEPVPESFPEPVAPEPMQEQAQDLDLEDDWGPIDTSSAPAAFHEATAPFENDIQQVLGIPATTAAAAADAAEPASFSDLNIDGDLDSWGAVPASGTSAGTPSAPAQPPATHTPPRAQHTPPASVPSSAGRGERTPPYVSPSTSPSTAFGTASTTAPPTSFLAPPSAVSPPEQGAGASATASATTFQAPPPRRAMEFATPGRSTGLSSVSSTKSATDGFVPPPTSMDTVPPARTFPLPSKIATPPREEAGESVKVSSRLSATPIQDFEDDMEWDDVDGGF